MQQRDRNAGQRQMKVKELIEILQTYDPELMVCAGDWEGERNEIIRETVDTKMGTHYDSKGNYFDDVFVLIEGW